MNNRLNEELRTGIFWVTAHSMILVMLFLLSGNQSQLIPRGGIFLDLQVDQQNSGKASPQSHPKDSQFEKEKQSEDKVVKDGIRVENNPIEPLQNQKDIDDYKASEIEDLAEKYCRLFKQGQLKIKGNFAKDVPPDEIFKTFGCCVRVTSRTNERKYFPGNGLKERPYLTVPMSAHEVPRAIKRSINYANDLLVDSDYQVDLLLKPAYEVLIYRELYRLLKSEGLAQPQPGDVFRCVLYSGNRVELRRTR